MVAVAALALASAGCSLLPAPVAPQPASPPATPDPAAVDAAQLAEAVLALQHFAGSAPERQLTLLVAARDAAQQAPSPANQLRHALLLGLPGHPGTDPGMARQILASLLADTVRLSPTEQALAFVELRRLDRELALAAEVNQLQAEAGRIDAEALAAVNDRLLAETDENQRLRRALEDAQAKLAAIALIERQTSGRNDPGVPPEEP